MRCAWSLSVPATTHTNPATVRWIATGNVASCPTRDVAVRPLLTGKGRFKRGQSGTSGRSGIGRHEAPTASLHKEAGEFDAI